MPTYPVKNKETGETKVLNLTMKAYTEWREENPDWDRDWSEGCASMGEVGDWRKKTDGGWNEVLHKVSKQPGANVKPYKYY